MKQRIIYVCSPLRGNIKQNLENARSYCRYIATQVPNAMPLAPHLYCTGFLDDDDPTERSLGITYGIQLLALCDELWAFGIDHPSEGMKQELRYAKDHKIPIRNGFFPDKILNPTYDVSDLTKRFTNTPVVFLDFDGVLNHAGCPQETDFLPEAIDTLNRLYDEHHIRIVLSTSWTHAYPFTDLQKLLRQHDLYAPVIDKIPEYAGPYRSPNRTSLCPKRIFTKTAAPWKSKGITTGSAGTPESFTTSSATISNSTSFWMIFHSQNRR